MTSAGSQLTDANVVVIGAGVIGSALTYRLAQAGAKVTQVDRRYPGAGTSGASFAWLNAFSKPPHEYHELNASSIREHERLAAEVNGDWLHLDGSLTWIDDIDVAARQQFQQNLRQLAEWGYRVERTTPDVVARELEPDLTIDPARVSEVFVAPGEGWLDGVRMAHSLAHAAERRYGATFVHATVVGLGRVAHRVNSVELDDGRRLPADVILNAAGPDASHVAGLAEANLPLKREVGVLVTTRPTSACVRHVVRGPSAHLRPDGGSRLLLQRVEYDYLVTEQTATDVGHPVCALLMSDAAEILPAVGQVSPEAMRIGIRAMPVDGFSIVGFEPEMAGLYEVVTHSGITLSAILARLVTADLSGAQVSELVPFRPDRFRGRTAASTARA